GLATQQWPWLKKIALAAPSTAPGSASSNTMFGLLPPSSSETFFKFPAAAATISLPTSVEPVNAILSTPLCAASAAPAVSPSPVTTFTTPSGRPRLRHELGEAQRAQRRLLGGLKDRAVAGGQRRAELPRGHQQREVPRDDLPDLGVLRQAAREIYRRLMDAGDPALVDQVEATLRATPGVLGVGQVRVRWIGHHLRAGCEVIVDAGASAVQAHHVAVGAEHNLLNVLPRLAAALVHADPQAQEGADHHAALASH